MFWKCGSMEHDDSRAGCQLKPIFIDDERWLSYMTVTYDDDKVELEWPIEWPE